MPNNTARFISSRSNPISITQDRVKSILWYVSECFCILQKTNPDYSKSWCSKNTAYHFEDYLKMEFVDEFLKKNKHLLSNRISELEQINFDYENVRRYTDIEGIERSDKIDIYISKLGLQNVWNESEEHIYFVIECKRINGKPDYTKYTRDIEKFCNRNYKHLRLPFEGMIAFIENRNCTHEKLSKEISNTIAKSKTIKTIHALQKIDINNSFNGSYCSTHKKVFINNPLFTIYHLLFEYFNFISK